MTSQERLLLLSTIAILATHWVGTALLWYKAFPSYDIITHLIGGFWIAMILSTFLPRTYLPYLLPLALAVLLVWELFEFVFASYIRYAYNVTPGFQPSGGDTVVDIISGFIGALIAAVTLNRIK